MTLFRGYADDLPLMEWLQRAASGPPSGSSARTSTGARGSRAWRWRAGGRSVLGHVLEARRDRSGGEGRGLRAVVGALLIDDKDPDKSPSCSRRRAARSTRSRRRARARCARPWRRTRSTPSPSRRCAGIAEISEERDVPIEIHLSETEQEVVDCVAETGLRPAHTWTGPGCWDRAAARPLRLARPVRDRADRRAWGDDGHEPGRQPEARGRRGVPIRGGAPLAPRSAWARTVPAPTTPSTCSTT